ncbi:MAG: hypothetical protein SGILL_006318 [Bacillariaceae sp.]
MVPNCRKATLLSWSLTALLWSSCTTLLTAAAQDVATEDRILLEDEEDANTMHPSQTPSSAVSRITVASLFTSNGNVSVTSSPSLPPVPLAIVPAASDPFAVAPSLPPTVKPSIAPALSITNMDNGGGQDEVSQIGGVVKASLPKIAIEVETTNQAITSITKQKLMNDFWQGFVDNLIMASDLIPSSLFQSTTLSTSVKTLENPELHNNINATESLIIAVNGTAKFRMDQPPKADELQNSLRQSLASYLSFWGTHELEENLEEEYGLLNATVTSILVGEDRVGIEEEEDMRGYGNVEWAEDDAVNAASSLQSIGLHLVVAMWTYSMLALC